LKFLNKLGAGYEAEGVTYRKATKLEVTRYDQLKKQFDEKLKELLDDPKILSDSINTGALILDPSQDNPYSRTGELYVDSELEEINPLFTMQDQF
jgi:NDP-sugar pyrophosphorylase family protein